jgi:hypothetical protein
MGERNPCAISVVFFFLFFFLFVPSFAKEFFKPFRTEKSPKIDGILDDPVWQKAPSVSEFKSFVPDFGHEPSEKTLAYMAYDSENLYFAFKCYDSEPEKIKTAVAKRDTTRADDYVCVNLDTFNDQQSLYAFYVNPLGIQTDSRYSSGKEDLSVDIVWFSAGRLDPDGYSVELRIPFKSIRYAGKSRIEMSIFFERRISRRSEQVSYPALDPARGYFFLTQMMPLELYDIKRYTLLEILPAFTYSQKYFQEAGDLRQDTAAKDISLTGKYGLTSQLILDATWNPDFSQIEADAGQIDVNLRYDLYFPEKRPFFLEGNEMFLHAGSSEGDYLDAAVHTRTIIDPRVGIKLTGKVGKKDTIASIFALDESPSFDESYLPGGDECAGFAILRYKHAFANDGFIGGFYTRREYAGGFNLVAGSDGQVRLGRSSMLGFHGFGSWTKNGGGAQVADGFAFGLDYLYDTRALGISLGFHDISRNFQTDTGYLTRNGLARFRASVLPRIYPKSHIFRKLTPQISGSVLKDLFSGMYETDNSLSLQALLPGNTRITLTGGYSTEIFLGKRFDTSGWLIQALSQLSKKLTVRALFRRGNTIRYTADPYQGYGNRATGDITYQPSDKFNLVLNLVYSDLFQKESKEKVFDYAIWRGRLTYQMNKYLFFRGVLEYNSFREELLTDFLVSFTYIPGTVIQLGYGSLYNRLEWDGEEYRYADRFLEIKRGLFFKASYLWRL